MDPDWQERARCKDLSDKDADKYFFLGRGGSPGPAKRNFCNRCPVAKDCLDFAILYEETDIWAGTTEAERRRIAPLVRPRLIAEAREAGLPTERPRVTISPRQSLSGPIEYQSNEDELFDRYLSTLRRTGS